MCQYCEGTPIVEAKHFHDPWEIKIAGSSLLIFQNYDSYGYQDKIEVKICFCPLCGRDLMGKEEKEKAV